MNRKPKKQRLDILMVNRGLSPSRDKAKALIMAGEVRVDGETALKPGAEFFEDCRIECLARLPFVSRGGLKLLKAIEVFGLRPEGKTVLDIGSSTGGFVDCALQHGAARVFAVDVGYGQLAWKLRGDPRVAVMEKTNARYLDSLPEMPDIITADVSFISLTKILPAPLKLLKEGGELIALIKPQFEAGRALVGKKGVVRDAGVHKKVIADLCAAMANMGVSVKGLDYSPITGPMGNIEFLLFGQKTSEEATEEAGLSESVIDRVVLSSWAFLKKD